MESSASDRGYAVVILDSSGKEVGSESLKFCKNNVTNYGGSLLLFASAAQNNEWITAYPSCTFINKMDTPLCSRPNRSAATNHCHTL